MNLIKNTIVVPSTTPTPNQDSERVALFNEDGSPFSAGGGAIHLYNFFYWDNFGSYAALTGSPHTSTDLEFLFAVDEVPAEFAPGKILNHYVHPELVNFRNNVTALSLGNPDWMSVFGPGRLSMSLSMEIFFDAVQPADQLNMISFEVANNAWDPVVNGYNNRYIQIPLNHTFPGLENRMTTRDPVVMECSIPAGWVGSDVDFAIYMDHAVTLETYKVRTAAIDVVYIPFA